MKLTIHQELGIPETEIIINCAHMDARIQHLISLIRQHSFSLTGYQEEKEFQLPLEKIFFIDSVDGKTFLYLEKETYSCKDTLAVLEEKLVHTSFDLICCGVMMCPFFYRCYLCGWQYASL